jgi:hypothetical protein
MSKIKIMTYNIENMGNLFENDQFRQDSIEKVNNLEKIITYQQPHILGIVEASDKIKHHQYFIENTRLSDFGYKVGKSDHKRGRQDLVVYYQDPFEIVTIDAYIEFYETWAEDIDRDGIEEICEFERKPLEVLFRMKGTDITFLVILVANKSKGVFSINDIATHKHLALANRKKLLAQSKKIRSRVDQLMDEQPELPLIVMGDFNDDPGMDSYEKVLGASSIETVMGSVFEPNKILHNTLWYWCNTEREKDLWTTEYPDLIVQNFGLHKSWLDHIFISQNLLSESARLKYVMNSGEIIPKDADAKLVSDHYAVYCNFTVSI